MRSAKEGGKCKRSAIRGIPLLRIASQMINGHDADHVLLDAVDNAIWEVAAPSASKPRLPFGKNERIEQNAIDCSYQLIVETIAEPRALSFIQRTGVAHVVASSASQIKVASQRPPQELLANDLPWLRI